jgi:hypothetical protein
MRGCISPTLVEMIKVEGLVALGRLHSALIVVRRITAYAINTAQTQSAPCTPHQTLNSSTAAKTRARDGVNNMISARPFTFSNDSGFPGGHAHRRNRAALHRALSRQLLRIAPPCSPTGLRQARRRTAD